MAKSYLANIHTRKIIAENVIVHNLYMSKDVQLKKTCPYTIQTRILGRSYHEKYLVKA